MADVDIAWVKEQLTKNKTRRIVGDSVLTLLKSWEDVKEKNKDQKVDYSKDIVAIFAKLSLGHALVKEEKGETWVQVTPGSIVLADYVRIKSDAFDNKSGKDFNGRRGRVVGIRYGDIIIKSDDNKAPLLEGVHLRPDQLEKRL